MLDRKTTAWKKNRKLGDVYGGRTWPKVADRIFARCHSLKPPSAGEATPILIEDNPSRDFFFPICAAEALEVLNRLPNHDVPDLTHLWLRRVKRADFDTRVTLLAEYVCGSGVNVVVLYPWPKDMLLRFGSDRPHLSSLKRYAPWCRDLVSDERGWALRWNLDSLRRFYVEHLLFHEVGHHVDFYRRHWSKANRAQIEEYANQFAMALSAAGITLFEKSCVRTRERNM